MTRPTILRIRIFLTRRIHRLARVLSPRRPGRCDCPLCSERELRARIRTGMALNHPERILRHLPDDQEQLLLALAWETWPALEYIDIIAGQPGES